MFVAFCAVEKPFTFCNMCCMTRNLCYTLTYPLLHAVYPVL